MAEKRVVRGDLGSGLALAALGLYIVADARRWDYLGTDGPGAGFFPLWYGVAMIVLAGVLVISSLRRRSPGDGPGWPGLRRGLTAWLALAVTVASFKWLGFFVAFTALVFFVVAVVYRRPPASAAKVAIGCALAFYLAFPLALGVRLPTGVLGF